MDPNGPVGVTCSVDWSPLIAAMQTLLGGVTALVAAYTVRLLRNGKASRVGGRRAGDKAPAND